jgi:tetratricopeptide (TPR) repeat protein
MKWLPIVLFFVIVVTACKQKEDKPVIENKDSLNKSEFTLLNDQIAANPGNAALYFRRSQIFMQKKNTKQAFDDIVKAVSIDSTNAGYFLQLADISFIGLQIQTSIDAFKKAISLEPKNKDAHMKLAELYLYIKAYPQCLAEANEALMIDKYIAKAYFIKGFAYKETGDTSKALSSFQTVVEIQPEYYDAYIQLGNIQAARKNKIALQYYNNALRIQPSSTEAFYNRGLMYQNMGEIEKATEDYNSILKVDRNYADAHYNLGYIDLAFKKDYNSAINHFTDAIRINNQYAEAFYNRGVAYDFLGDKKSAEKDYRKALNIVPTFKLAKDRLKK